MVPLIKLIYIGKWCQTHHLTLVAKFLRMLQRILYNCDIPFETNIAKSVHFDHNGFGCVINSLSVIGEHTEIQHGVTLGIKYNSNNQRFIPPPIFRCRA